MVTDRVLFRRTCVIVSEIDERLEYDMRRPTTIPQQIYEDVFLPPSVRREVKGLPELLLRHVSGI